MQLGPAATLCHSQQRENPMRLSNAASALALLLALAVTAPVPAQERIEFGSRNFTDEEFLSGRAHEGEPVILGGQLRVPDSASPLPLAILLHGTDGPNSGAAANWRAQLTAAGFATFRLDSYTGRGLSQASTDQEQFGQFLQIFDAYRAAETLARNPRIDPGAIVLMGFSRGGNAALYTAISRFDALYGPEGLDFAGHFPFYPACNFTLEGELETTGAPIRLFIGADDDWTPAAPCEAYVSNLRAAGADAEITIYPGALHAFDSLLNRQGAVLPHAQTSRNCWRVEDNARLVNRQTGQPFTYADDCVETGVSIRHDPEAFAAAKEAVFAFLLGLAAQEP
jgi:dienelactone hydrolase